VAIANAGDTSLVIPVGVVEPTVGNGEVITARALLFGGTNGIIASLTCLIELTINVVKHGIEQSKIDELTHKVTFLLILNGICN
jgi:hypothetical protein